MYCGSAPLRSVLIRGEGTMPQNQRRRLTRLGEPMAIYIAVATTAGRDHGTGKLLAASNSTEGWVGYMARSARQSMRSSMKETMRTLHARSPAVSVSPPDIAELAGGLVGGLAGGHVGEWSLPVSVGAAEVSETAATSTPSASARFGRTRATRPADTAELFSCQPNIIAPKTICQKREPTLKKPICCCSTLP